VSTWIKPAQRVRYVYGKIAARWAAEKQGGCNFYQDAGPLGRACFKKCFEKTFLMRLSWASFPYISAVGTHFSKLSPLYFRSFVGKQFHLVGLNDTHRTFVRWISVLRTLNFNFDHENLHIGSNAAV